MNVRIILVTAPSKEVAQEIARSVVEERLAACVNILPGVVSIYRWQEAVEEDSECLMILKTTAENVDLLQEKVLTLHPYDTPEFISLSPEHVEAKYLAWLKQATILA